MGNRGTGGGTVTAPQRQSFSPIGTLSITVQGFYYVITGAWPVLHPTSYEVVSGAEASYWLVVLVGVVAFLTGLGLLWAVRQRTVMPATWTLAVVAATAFLIIDLWYVLGVVIPRVYMIDAIAEAVFIAGAVGGWRQSRMRTA